MTLIPGSVADAEVCDGLPPAGRAAFLSRFLGLDEHVDRVILTPLSTFHSNLSDSEPAPSIWPSSLVRGVPMVQGPQGRAIVDAIFNLPAGCEVVFLGIGGGLRPPAVAGGWVCVERAWNGPQAHDRSLQPPPELDLVTAVTVGSLTESWLATPSLARQAHVVDMETSHIYEVATRRGVRALSLLLVSDEPPARPFWDTDLGALVPRIAPVLHILDRWLATAARRCRTPHAET
jgi:hypothetical protein